MSLLLWERLDLIPSSQKTDVPQRTARSLCTAARMKAVAAFRARSGLWRVLLFSVYLVGRLLHLWAVTCLHSPDTFTSHSVVDVQEDFRSDGRDRQGEGEENNVRLNVPT